MLAIAILLAVIGLIVWRLPKIDIGHEDAFIRRRWINWFPLGMTYAFLYMGRYNLAAAKDVGALTQEQYGDIFGWGSLVYGLAFLINGPLTDRYGGRVSILAAAAGSMVCNAAMGVAMMQMAGDPQLPTVMAGLYASNMYFQSFGAVSVVKVNSAWFHVRERGVFGGLFGVLISLGIFFAFDLGLRIAENMAIGYLFWIPAGILGAFVVIDGLLVQANPSGAGFEDFDTGDASSGEDDTPDPLLTVVKRMVTNPVLVTIAVIEFCSGFLRNAIMHWYRDFAKGMALTDGNFIYENWGLMLCLAGIFGGMFAGVISDHLFQSRRGPVAAVLYGIMVVGAILIWPLLNIPSSIGWIAIVMSMSVIGVHGMLSGTASADFGGKKNAGVAVGLIDACVYMGSTVQSFLLGRILPEKGTAEAADIANWGLWPMAMLPFAILGLILSITVWNAKPKGHTAKAG